MNEVEKTIRTPIEVALDVDGEGMTTARKLYEFLELNPAVYARWCKNNILENSFAIENEDYFYSTSMLSEQKRGNFAQDFKLTAHFAKKLCMKGNGARADEAREYFARIEEKAKQAVIDLSQLPPEMQMFKKIWDEQAKLILDQRKDHERIDRIEETTEAIKEAVRPILDNWRNDMNEKFNRIQRSTDRPFKDLRIEMYKKLENRAGCDLDARIRNKRQRMAEQGCTKTDINKLNKMDIIEADKKLREIFSKIVTEYEIKYCA